MNFFQILQNLFYKKTQSSNLNVEDLSEFQPYLINRWLSFYDKSMVNFCNNFLNKNIQLFDDRNQLYKFYINIIPKLRYKKISYIKKKKKEKLKDDELVNNIKLYAKNNFMSQREVNMLINIKSKLNDNI